MWETDIKLYPKTTKDNWWIKFYFDYLDKHYTIRFAWNPILLLEAKFKELWWKDFNWAYASAKEKSNHAEKNILLKAGSLVTDFLSTLEQIDKMWRSPFVVYIKNRNEFKS